jgi:hypothetical protein
MEVVGECGLAFSHDGRGEQQVAFVDHPPSERRRREPVTGDCSARLGSVSQPAIVSYIRRPYR